MPITLVWTARVFLVGLIAFAIYYSYKILTDFIPFSFGGPIAWQAHWMVEEHVLAPLWLRASHFALWMPTMIATMLMVGSAIWLVVLLLRGTIFY